MSISAKKRFAATAIDLVTGLLVMGSLTLLIAYGYELWVLSSQRRPGDLSFQHVVLKHKSIWTDYWKFMLYCVVFSYPFYALISELLHRRTLGKALYQLQVHSERDAWRSAVLMRGIFRGFLFKTALWYAYTVIQALRKGVPTWYETASQTSVENAEPLEKSYWGCFGLVVASNVITVVLCLLEGLFVTSFPPFTPVILALNLFLCHALAVSMLRSAHGWFRKAFALFGFWFIALIYAFVLVAGNL
jgi:hypothetical protein